MHELFAADPGPRRALCGDAATCASTTRNSRSTTRCWPICSSGLPRAGVVERRDAMFAGEHINVTEDRAVLHTALRAPRSASIKVDGDDVVPDVHEVLDAMGVFAERIRADERITDVVNIGIGGSDLGPAMAAQALAAFGHPRITLPLRLQRRRCRRVRHAAAGAARVDAVHRRLEDVRHDRDAHQRPHRSRLAGRRRSARRRWPTTSSRSRPTPSGSPSSGSTPPTCSASGTGSAAATRSTRRSACR